MTASFGVFGALFFFWLLLMIVAVGSLGVGIAALIDVAGTPIERFGPWWDNTRQAWIVGLAVAFLIPAGPLIGGILWFSGGKRELRTRGVAGRPFWSSAPRPAPPYGPQPPYGKPPPGPDPSQHL